MRNANKKTAPAPNVQPRTRKPVLTVVPPPTATPRTKTPKVMLVIDEAAQNYMADCLTAHGWALTPPATIAEGLYPERFLTAIVQTPASKTMNIKATSHHGRALLASVEFDRTRPGYGLTRAETQYLASLETNGVTGSPWHRVGDLVTFGLLAPKYDATGLVVKRLNPHSNRRAEVLVLTPKGRAVARTLRRRLAAGKGHVPVLLNPAPKAPAPATPAARKTAPKRPALVPVSGAGVLVSSADYLAGQKKPRKKK